MSRASPALFHFPIVDPNTGLPSAMFAQAWQSLLNQIGVSVTTVELLTAANASEGLRAMVSDSTLAAAGNFGAAVVGGGSNVVPVFCDGTHWRIG